MHILQSDDKSLLPNAVELVKKALDLASDDLNIHALAVNIYDEMDEFFRRVYKACGVYT